MEPLKSVEEAAETLSLSAWTVRAYVRQGKIRPVRIGRRVLIEPQELRRLVEEGRDDSGRARVPKTSDEPIEAIARRDGSCGPVM